MRIPTLRGLIRRRLLVNFRVDAEVMARFLPAPFRPKLQGRFAIAGICLIRLEEIRLAGLPAWFGMASENAAHRVAVLWNESSGEPREGVFIPRRDTNSRLNHLAGGRPFSGEHHLAHFVVEDNGAQVALAARAHDGGMAVEVKGEECDALPSTSCFASLAEASAFFEGGSLGFSVTRQASRLDGLRLELDAWKVRPLAVRRVESSFFADEKRFPAGSVTFDHALVMRDIEHRWLVEPDLAAGPPCSQAEVG